MRFSEPLTESHYLPQLQSNWWAHTDKWLNGELNLRKCQTLHQHILKRIEYTSTRIDFFECDRVTESFASIWYLLSCERYKLMGMWRTHRICIYRTHSIGHESQKQRINIKDMRCRLRYTHTYTNDVADINLNSKRAHIYPFQRFGRKFSFRCEWHGTNLPLLDARSRAKF